MAVSEELASLEDASPLGSNWSPLSVSFQLLEATVRDKNKTYLDKVESLIFVLESVVIDRFSGLTIEQTVMLFHFLRKHTLCLILHGDWLKYRVVQLHMRTMFKHFELFSNRKCLSSIAVSVKHLIELMKDPWGPLIKKFLCQEHCSEEELLSFVKSEIDSVLNIRLEILIAAGCDCQAILLVEKCLQCVSKPENNNFFSSFSNEITTMKDIYLILLVKRKNNSKLSNEVSKMSLNDGLMLVRRCTRGAYLNCVNKSLLKMVEVVANMVLVSAMIHPVTDEFSLQCLIEDWFNLYADTHVNLLFHLLKKMCLSALTSYHIYFLVQIFENKMGILHKPFCIEMYIRALTVNLNELEKHKSNIDQENTRQMEVQLSKGFLSLANYLKDDIVTSRECLLTSFSLDPTSDCFKKIIESAITSGKFKSSIVIQDVSDSDSEYKTTLCSNCKTNRIADQDRKKPCSDQNSEYDQYNGIDKCDLSYIQDSGNTDINGTNSETCNKGLINEILLTSKSNKNVALPTPIHISSANEIGISQTLYDDLLTVISSARYHLLNWNLDWEELRSRCELYKKSGKEIRSSVKDLKYLQLDYSNVNNLTNRPNPNTEANTVSRPFELCSVNNSNNLNFHENTVSAEYEISIPAKIVDEDSQNSSETNNYELSSVILVYKCKHMK